MVENILISKFKKYSSGIILFLYPVILLNINSTWIFTPVTNFIPDPWFYFSYFRYFYIYAPEFPSNIHYFVERITWNIPGYYIYRLFPPVMANYILHLLVYYVAIFSLYGILNNLFDRRTALLSALFMGGYPWFLRAAGWDYVDGTGIAHTLLLLYILTLAPHSKYGNLLFIFAGIVNASLIITNLFWISFTPSWLVYFVLLNLRSKKLNLKRTANALTQFVGGNIIMVGLVTIFSKIVLGRYSYFYARSLDFAQMLAQSEDNIKEVIRIYGHMTPYWHILPLLAGIIAAVKLSSKTHNVNLGIFKAVVALFSIAYGWLIVWHIFKIPFLFVFLYSSFLIPAVFILFGSLLSAKLNALTDSEFDLILFSGLIILVAPITLVSINPSMTSLQGNSFLILTFCCILLAGFLFFSRMQASILILLSFSALSFLGGKGSYVYTPDRLKARDNFNAIIDASQAIDSYYPNRNYADFRLWFRSDKNYDTFFSLAAIYLYPWGSALDNPYSGKQPSDTFSLHRYNEILEGDEIIILSSTSDAEKVLKEANRALLERKVKLALNSIGEIHEGSTRFFIYFTSVAMAP